MEFGSSLVGIHQIARICRYKYIVFILTFVFVISQQIKVFVIVCTLTADSVRNYLYEYQ
jgi:hypothetical protein